MKENLLVKRNFDEKKHNDKVKAELKLMEIKIPVD